MIVKTEVIELLATLEDTYWRLKEVDTEDDEEIEEMVYEVLNALDKYFA